MRRSQHENDDSVAEAVTARYREKRKGSRRVEQTDYASKIFGSGGTRAVFMLKQDRASITHYVTSSFVFRDEILRSGRVMVVDPICVANGRNLTAFYKLVYIVQRNYGHP